MNQLNYRYDHAYAILRLEETEASGSLEDAITVKLVVWDEATAEAEVERLNKLNADKGCRYIYQLTRIEKQVPISMRAIAEERSGALGE